MSRFENLGIIKNERAYNQELLTLFESKISHMKSQKEWSKKELVDLFFKMIPNFGHEEIGKYLDSKM